MNLAQLRPSGTALSLGVAYKPGVADTGETPAKDVAEYLISIGVSVCGVDPFVQFFEIGTKWDSEYLLSGATVITAQQCLPEEELVKNGDRILHCSGIYKEITEISQL